MKLPTLPEIRKALVAVAGVLAQVIELGVLHGSVLHYAQVASGAVAAVLVYVVPNGRTAVPAAPVAAPPAQPPTA